MIINVLMTTFIILIILNVLNISDNIYYTYVNI